MSKNLGFCAKKNVPQIKKLQRRLRAFNVSDLYLFFKNFKHHGKYDFSVAKYFCFKQLIWSTGRCRSAIAEPADFCLCIEACSVIAYI